MKNKIIITGKDGRPSTKLVYSHMTSGNLLQRRQIFRGKGQSKSFIRQYFRSFNNNDIETMTKVPEVSAEDSILIRWGSRMELPTNGSTVVYNRADAISNITNKYRSRQLFAENGVATPKNITLDNVVDADFPIIARPFQHSKGRNFIELNDITALRNHYNNSRYYYSAFVNKTHEFRIHVALGKVLGVMEKNPVEGSIAWNRAVTDSDPFTYIPWSDTDSRNLKPVLLEALKAVDAVGADMGGVDVMMTADGSASVLEVNSAPTLNSSDYMAQRWAKMWDFMFKSETRISHWDYTQFDRASSLIWKNFQLASTPAELNL